MVKPPVGGAQRRRIAGTRLSSSLEGFLGRAPHALRCHDTGCRPSERVSHTVWTSSVCLHATVEHREHKYGSLLPLREGTGTSRSAAQQWHAARGMQNLAKQPKDDHATSLGQNRSAPCIRGRQCAPRRSGAAIRQHRGGIPLGSRSKCGVRPRAASAMVPRGGHRLNEPVVGETGGREGGGPDPLHPETPPFSKRVSDGTQQCLDPS